MGHSLKVFDGEESDDDFHDAYCNIQLEFDAQGYGANRIKRQNEVPDNGKPVQKLHFGLGSSRQNKTASSDPFSFISRLDVRAYVAGSVPNRQDLGMEMQEPERKETEGTRRKDLDQNKHILYQDNLVTDREQRKAEDILKFHKEEDSAFVLYLLI